MDELKFTCSAIGAGRRFQVENTGRGADLSPEFLIENLSPDAAALAILLEDVSHPLFRDFAHWVVWNIPATEVIPGALPAGRRIAQLDGAQQGRAYGRFRYAGPRPPRGKQHAYRFTVFALDSMIHVPFPQTKRSLLRSAAGHILQKGMTEGLFE